MSAASSKPLRTIEYRLRWPCHRRVARPELLSGHRRVRRQSHSSAPGLHTYGKADTGRSFVNFHRLRLDKCRATLPRVDDGPSFFHQTERPVVLHSRGIHSKQI